MIEKGPGQDYLTEDHTIRHMRSEFFMPDLANRERRDGEEPGDDALARARRLVRNIRSRRPERRLDEGIRERILRDFPNIHPGSVRLVKRVPGGRTVWETVPC